MKRLASWLAVIAVLAAAGFAAVRWGENTLDTRTALNEPLIVRVPVNSRFNQVAAELAKRGAIAHPWIWTLHARSRGLAAKIKAGEYSIAPGTTPREILRKLVAGEVLLHAITIVEGWRYQDLRDAMRNNPAIRYAELADGALMAKLGSARVVPEGQFLPETYKFPSGTADVEILAKAHAALLTQLNSAWAGRDPRLPLRDPQELLILASIVEKETGLAAERGRIAGVYAQRLINGMRLQADPTIIYGLGAGYDGNLHTVDLRTDGPYNTYTRSGLPPTPIALPGAASIRAAAHPELNGELYFVATGHGGGHIFSSTLEEHNRAVAAYVEASRARASSSAIEPMHP